MPASSVLVRSAYYTGLRALGVPPLARRLREAGVILCYHNVWPAGNAASVGDPSLHLSLDRFAKQVRWLKRHYAIVPLHELVHRLSARRPVRGMAAITFDDGYTGVFCHAWPLLLDLGAPATVFVVADAAGRDAFWWDDSGATRDAGVPPASHRPADWDMIARGIDAGLTLGVHSATHRTLTTLGDAELERELVSSWEAIRARTGARADSFAYPYWRWDSRVRAAVRAAGYRAAVTLDYGLVRPGADLWTLPRVNVPASISRPAFEAWAAGLAPRRGRTG